MDFRDLKYFEAIADEGHLGRAAERLYRTQPALTKCIDRLEEELGAKLFERAGRGLRLTGVGEVLLARTRQMSKELLAEASKVTVALKVSMNDVLLGALKAGELDLVLGPLTQTDETFIS